MNMGMDASGKSHPPKAFGVVQKGKKTDLLDKLKPIEFTSLTNNGQGYELTGFPLKGMGDFIFYLDPGPYFEKSEDAYLQQCTKVIVNRGGAPTGWNEPAGLPVEILPLDKPYALWTGNVFRGVVVRKDGDKYVPVPGAEIEVEYLKPCDQGACLREEGCRESSSRRVCDPDDTGGQGRTIRVRHPQSWVVGLRRAWSRWRPETRRERALP